MAETVARRAAGAVVANLELDAVRPVADRHVGLRGARVLECVRQPLLDDPVRGQVDRAWERDRVAVEVDVDGKSRARHVVGK